MDYVQINRHHVLISRGNRVSKYRRVKYHTLNLLCGILRDCDHYENTNGTHVFMFLESQFLGPLNRALIAIQELSEEN